MSRQGRWRLGVVAAVVALVAGTALAPHWEMGQNLLPFVAFFLLIIPAHELGHALAGRLVGHRIVLIQLGAGPRLFGFEAWGTKVVVGALPVGGATMGFPARPLRGVRARQWIFAAGGLCANVVLVYALGKRGFVWHADEPHPFLAMAAAANWTVIVLNALPFRLPEGAMTDGYQLLTIPFWPPARVERAHIIAESFAVSAAADRGDTARALELAEALRRRHPTHPSAALTLGFVLSRLHRYEEACALWRETLAQPSEPATVVLLKNNLAWSHAVTGDPAQLDEADRFSDEALAAAPEAPALRGTRGAVLLRLGRSAEALPLLEQSLDQPPTPARAYTKAFLARALALEGRKDEARRALDEARALDATCAILPWAEAALDGAAPPREATSASPPRAGATEQAARLRVWRRDVRIVSFAAMVLMSGALGADVVYPFVVLIFLSLVPDEAGVLALAAAFGWTALVRAVPQWDLGPSASVVPTRDTLLMVAVTAAALWLFWRHRRLEPQRRTRAPLVLGLILAPLLVLFSLAAATDIFFTRSSLGIHGALGQWVGQGAGALALAAVWLTSRRRWVRAAAVVPIAATLVAAVAGSRWTLDHRILRDVPLTGAAVTWSEPQPATPLRARTLSAPGSPGSVSPGGRAFVLVERYKPRLHVADFGDRLVDVEGSAAAFVDDDRLLVVRAAAGGTGATLAEIHPFASAEPVWSKPVPGLGEPAVKLAFDRETGTVLLSGETKDGAALGLRTAPDGGSAFADVPCPRTTVDSDDVAADYLGGDACGEVVVRGGDLRLVTAAREKLLAGSMGSTACAYLPSGLPTLWCVPSGSLRASMLLRLDAGRGVAERVPGSFPVAQDLTMLDATHLAALGQDLRVLDLASRRGVRLTAPTPARWWSGVLVPGGALAVFAREEDGPRATVTVYALPGAAPPR